MENFIVSARKYRPASFDTVVGQAHITNTLKNAIKNNHLAQAFLFCGPRGVGKTTCARILAKTINCQNITEQTEACNECESCKSFNKGASMNIHELDAASNNSVDDIRSLVEQVRYAPQSGKYKIYIIDEVHMLSQSAFNAFLKTLEEPPPYAIFILATTEKHKIIPTILSRCQIFDFNRIRVEDIAIHLDAICKKEQIKSEHDALHLIASKADGALRDALSMFDQIVSFSGGNLTYKAVIDNLNILDYDYYFKLSDFIYEENPSATLLLFDEVLSKGFDGNHFINGLSEHFRNLLVCKDPATVKLLEVGDGIREKYLRQSAIINSSFLLSGLQIANQADLQYKASKNQRLHIELALLKMCHLPSAINLLSDEGLKKKTVTPEKKEKSNSEVTGAPPVSTTTEAKKLNAETFIKEEKKINPSLSGSTRLPSLQSLHTEAISETIKTAVHEAKKEVPEIRKTNFDLDTLKFFWDQYQGKILSEKRMSFSALLNTSKYKISENSVIEIEIANKVQLEMFMEEKGEFLSFIQEKLDNPTIDFQFNIIEENTSGQKNIFTSKDKFQHLAEKKPLLLDFKRKFDLDLEY